MDYNGTVAFTCTGAPLGASCQIASTVVLNMGAPATFTVTVPTSGKAVTRPNIARRGSPRMPAIPSVFAVWFYSLLAMLVLRFCRGTDRRVLHANYDASRLTIACVISALLLIPLVSAMNGCGGGGTTSAPVAQGTSIVTPSGTSVLVLTPTANSASGKAALQLSPIQLTLVVN